MGNLSTKIWKVTFLYFAVVLLVCFVLFEAILTHNKILLHKEQRVTAQVGVEKLAEPSSPLKIASSILLLPDVYIHKENVVVAVDYVKNQAIDNWTPSHPRM